MLYSSHGVSQHHIETVRAVIGCSQCGHTFAAPKGRYYWCKCGEPLTEVDELSSLPQRSRRFVTQPAALRLPRKDFA